MKHVQACSSARKDHESSFYRCGGPVTLVIAFLSAERVRKGGLNRRGRAMKHVQTGKCARKELESSFYQCGGAVKLVQA